MWFAAARKGTATTFWFRVDVQKLCGPVSLTQQAVAIYPGFNFSDTYGAGIRTAALARRGRSRRVVAITPKRAALTPARKTHAASPGTHPSEPYPANLADDHTPLDPAEISPVRLRGAPCTVDCEPIQPGTGRDGCPCAGVAGRSHKYIAAGRIYYWRPLKTHIRFETRRSLGEA